MVSQDTKSSKVDLPEAGEILSAKERQLQIEREELRRESQKKWVLTSLLLVFVLILLLGLVYSVYLVSEETRIKSKAESSALTRQVELANSYLFASPLKARAGSNERIRITVFILDSRGLGVAGKRVVLDTDGDLSIEHVQPITDDLGRATFDIYSQSRNQYVIQASVDGLKLGQRVIIDFY